MLNVALTQPQSSKENCDTGPAMPVFLRSKLCECKDDALAKYDNGIMEYLHSEELNEFYFLYVYTTAQEGLSLSKDPSKTKVVGVTGEACRRRTAGSSRTNLTVLFCVSTSGVKLSPQVIFKGKKCLRCLDSR